MKNLTGAETGFLLLTSQLGNPDRKPLTVAQFRVLAKRAGNQHRQEQDREMTVSDLTALGYNRSFSAHILGLLEEKELLCRYLQRAEKADCVPITRATESYPLILRKRLGLDSPGVLWAKGDISLLDSPAISLVGSRDLREESRDFAEAVGSEAARQGLALVSGNARGADKTAQKACLDAGGSVISIVADSLASHTPGERMLYLSEMGYEEEFSAQRALSRNRCIHALGAMVFVAQATLDKGGTWDGTVKNLRHGWSPVACFRDGSAASRQLEKLGAYLVEKEDLKDLTGLLARERNFLEDI